MFGTDLCLKESEKWLCLPSQKTKKLKRTRLSHGLTPPTQHLLSPLLTQTWILESPVMELIRH